MPALAFLYLSIAIIPAEASLARRLIGYEGSTVRLPCREDQPRTILVPRTKDVHVIWYKDSKIVARYAARPRFNVDVEFYNPLSAGNASLESLSGALSIHSLTIAQEGKYWCTYNDGVYRTALQIAVRPSSPRIYGLSRPMVENATRLAHCNVSRIRPPLDAIRWRQIGRETEFSGETVTMQLPDGTFTQESRLRITPSLEMNGQKLVCQLYSSTNKSSDEPVIATTTVMAVRPQPINSSTIFALTGSRVQLECLPDRRSVKSFTWFRGRGNNYSRMVATYDHSRPWMFDRGARFYGSLQKRRVYMSVDDGRLTIKRAARHLQGWYTCVSQETIVVYLVVQNSYPSKTVLMVIIGSSIFSSAFSICLSC